MTSRNRFGSVFCLASSCHSANNCIGLSGGLAMNATFDRSILVHFPLTTVFQVPAHAHTRFPFPSTERNLWAVKIYYRRYSSESDKCVDPIVAEWLDDVKQWARPHTCIYSTNLFIFVACDMKSGSFLLHACVLRFIFNSIVTTVQCLPLNISLGLFSPRFVSFPDPSALFLFICLK